MELEFSLTANSMMVPSRLIMETQYAFLILKWRMEGQPMADFVLCSTKKVKKYMWIHWQRWEMSVDGKRSQGKCKMDCRIKKLWHGFQMHAHSSASFKSLEWKTDDSLSSNKMELLPFLKSSTMLQKIKRIILMLIIKNQLTRKRYQKARCFWKLTSCLNKQLKNNKWR
jgi:hypothetical protein